MTTYAGAQDAIPGDLDGLDSAVGTLSAAADGASSLSADLRKTVDSTEDFWASPSGTQYRVSAQKQIGAAGMLVGPLDTASQAFATLARELRGARSTVERALADSVALGMGPTDLVGNPFAVLGFIFRNPQHAPTVAGLFGDIAGARVAAGAAHTAFTASLSGVRDGIGGADERLLGSRRGPDERGGRRIDEDERRGREPGGDGDGHFDNDWAGRAILERYLRGGDDWTITDDPEWSEYMKANGMLRDQLQGQVQTAAQHALDKYNVTGAAQDSFDERFSAQLENGEGIVGYQYLHGTNRNWRAPAKVVLDANGNVISGSGYPYD